jgi:hypothetical protein
MLNQILGDLNRILRGKNGNLFFVIFALILIVFILKILPSLIWLAVLGGAAYLAFKYLGSGKKG